MSAVTIDVTNLLQRPGTQEPLEVEMSLSGLSLGTRQVDLERPVVLKGVLESIGMGVLLRGDLQADLSLECSRCLGRFHLDAGGVIEELFARPSSKGALEEEEFEEAFEIVDGKIDIEPAVRQAILIQVPFKPLCREECSGLCSVCGRNLNEEPHECPKEPIDVRMSKLVDLKRTLEEKKRRQSG